MSGAVPNRIVLHHATLQVDLASEFLRALANSSKLYHPDFVSMIGESVRGTRSRRRRSLHPDAPEVFLVLYEETEVVKTALSHKCNKPIPAVLDFPRTIELHGLSPA